VERALRALEEEERDSARASEFRRIGEALLASVHTVTKGMQRAEIPDPHTGETLTVRLNAKLTASANAELYFKRARKATRRGEQLEGRRRALVDRKRTLENLEQRLAGFGPSGPDADWLREARDSRVELPLSIDQAKDIPPEDRLPSAIRPRRYALSQGWELLVGKSNRGNEVLTHEIARPGDIWMHADQAAGSHAVLRHHEKGKEPSQAVLLAAAAIAAFFSKARNSAKVSVIVSKKKHVRRPRKAPVGTVTVGEHRTFMVAPHNPDEKER
jgi:predicted ribosome quality control (RQC) complex YloA/Tae2 family protein